jgi:hypothetical protein
MPCVTGTSYECSGPGNCAGRQFCRSGFLTDCACQGTLPPSSNDAGTSGMRDGGTAASDASTPGTDSGSGGRDAAPEADSGRDTGTPATTEEDCNNNRDDDGDGDADCADSECTERLCVDAVPDGWDGPFLIYQGEEDPPECGGGFPDEALNGGTAVTADPAECSSCSCSGAGSCPNPRIETGGDEACGNSCTSTVANSCTLLSTSCLSGLNTGYVETKLPTGAGAGCTPSAQSPTVPAANWEEHAFGCAPAEALSRAGCGRTQVCAPAAPFEGALCIAHDGDVACPSGTYDDRRVYFTGIDDTRGCSACECGADCDYTWRVYDASDTSCATPLFTLDSPGQCEAVSPSSGSIRVGATVATPTAACDPSGGTPTGGAQGADPVTVCCL